MLGLSAGVVGGGGASLSRGRPIGARRALFLPTTTGWAEALRARLADPGVAAVAAHTLVQMGQCSAKAPARFLIQGRS